MQRLNHLSPQLFYLFILRSQLDGAVGLIISFCPRSSGIVWICFFGDSTITTPSVRPHIIRVPPGPSSHNLGTCRQSARREDGVCNKWGQAHDIKNLFFSDGSQFTTAAAANPTLTIVALAIRQADYIADQMAKQISKTCVIERENTQRNA
jgi:choline dehydrogenase-like flavoprotein